MVRQPSLAHVPNKKPSCRWDSRPFCFTVHSRLSSNNNCSK